MGWVRLPARVGHREMALETRRIGHERAQVRQVHMTGKRAEQAVSAKLVDDHEQDVVTRQDAGSSPALLSLTNATISIRRNTYLWIFVC